MVTYNWEDNRLRTNIILTMNMVQKLGLELNLLQGGI